MLLEGLHIPVTTPFHGDGRLNTHKLAANVVRYSLTPAAGRTVLAPSGEPTLLNDEQTSEALRVAAEAAAPEKLLIAGIARDSVRSTLDLATFAAEQDYDAGLISAPAALDAATQIRELLTYFRAVGDRAEVRQQLANLRRRVQDRKSTRLNSSHEWISYAVF